MVLGPGGVWQPLHPPSRAVIRDSQARNWRECGLCWRAVLPSRVGTVASAAGSTDTSMTSVAGRGKPSQGPLEQPPGVLRLSVLQPPAVGLQ